MKLEDIKKRQQKLSEEYNNLIKQRDAINIRLRRIEGQAQLLEELKPKEKKNG